MQIADLAVSCEMGTPPMLSSLPAAAFDFFQLLGEMMRSDVWTAQTLPPDTDDFSVPTGGSVAPETLTDPLTEHGTETVSEVVRHNALQALDDGRDVMTSDQSSTAFALAFLAGTINMVAFERLAEELCAVSIPAGTDAFDPAALSPFSETAQGRTPVVSINVKSDQHLFSAEPQGNVGYPSSLTVTLSATDTISLIPARVIEEPPRGLGEEGSVRLTLQGKPALSKAEGPVPSGSTRLTIGSVEGSGDQSSAITELLVQQSAIGRGEGTVVSDSTPLTTGLVEGGPATPRPSIESAGLPMMASDETTNSGDSAGAIIRAHDPSDGTVTEERPQLAAQPNALRGKLGVEQEQLGDGSESEEGLRRIFLPAPGSDRDHGGEPHFGEVSSTRADASRLGASAVEERDRSLALQVTQQIMAAARLGRRENGTSVRLRLRPESLGELLIQISWKEKGIVAGIQAESPVTARLLQEDLGHLKATLGEQGITVNDLGVQVGVDLRHGRASDDRFPATTTTWVAQDTRPWVARDEVLPLANLIRHEGLIDIRV